MFAVMNCFIRQTQMTSKKLTASLFLDHYISDIGIPVTTTKDRDSHFQSTILNEFTWRLRVQHITTTVYHLTGNVSVGEFHNQIKRLLMSQAEKTKWIDALTLSFLGIQSMIKEDIGWIKTKLIYCTTLIMPEQLVSNDDEIQRWYI